MLLKTCNSEFHEIITIFTNQNVRPLEIEDKVYLALLINKEKWHALRVYQCDDIP